MHPMFGRLVMALLISGLIASAGCNIGGKTDTTGYSTITAKDLQAKIDAGEQLTIIDLREPELYRVGHIPGAKNIPFEQFNDRMKELSPSSKIVLVCHTGPMGEVSGSLLAERGYADISNLSGGMAAWRGKLEK